MSTDDIQPYGVGVCDADIEELRETGELRFQYFTADGEDNIEVVLYLDNDDDRDGGGHKVTTTLQ
jgi:hypothetical protein